MRDLAAPQELMQAQVSRERPKLHGRRFSKKTLDAIFIIVMLAYPVTQFAVTWAFVNFGALSMAFNGSDNFNDFQFTFYNFEKIFKDLGSTVPDQANFLHLNAATIVLLNSLSTSLK